jgi:hypothetical protein
MQTGDWAIVAGVTAVCLYEKLVRNDSDLISNRVSAYRKHRAGRVVADAVILATAIHLMEAAARRPRCLPLADALVPQGCVLTNHSNRQYVTDYPSSDRDSPEIPAPTSPEVGALSCFCR